MCASIVRYVPLLLLALVSLGADGHTAWADHNVEALHAQVGADRGICVLIEPESMAFPAELAAQTELTVLAQSADAARVRAMREITGKAGLLGSRVYVVQADADRPVLAENIADAVIVNDRSIKDGEDQERLQARLLTQVRPGGRLVLGKRTVVKPEPEGFDDWRHPYHGPDNNPQSRDRVARAPYLTRFLATPWYGPMPEVTVVSGGRMFKAWGHIAFKKREWPLLNTLTAFNAYNGTVLWQRKLADGFMVHRNTIVATPETLFLADDQSCKLLDAATGKLTGEIIPPNDATPDKVWKWMALEDGVLYALVGGPEKKATVRQGTRTAAGWPWNELGEGYAMPEYPWGFGTTLLAFDVATRRVLWSHRETEPLDSRAACLAAGRLFFYSHEKFLGALDAKTGNVLWKTGDPAILAAIGKHGRAQNPREGYSSQVYAKCNEQAIFFAGPQRSKLLAVGAKDGKLLWQYPHGNYQLVLRDDAVYAMGRTEESKKFDPASGEILGALQCFRGNCTRATGTIDSIFTRGYRHSGTQRLVLDGDRSTRIPLMRPACQDGVVVANGQLYWGPWMCDCNLQLVGIISLGPAGDFDFAQKADEAERLETLAEASGESAEFEVTENDWPTYRGDNARSAGTHVKITDTAKELWQFKPAAPRDTTAAVAAGNLVFIGGEDGSIRALESATGKPRWIAYTGGRVRYPPAVAEGRVFAGSHDGWVYAWEAATGKPLWRFRAAPQDRFIPVYGNLSSIWPVAGGVLVENGTVYAAAGIASYDGTHVYALDAATGQIRWQNNTSGRLVSDDLVSGVSVQGHLLLHEDRLYLAGGNVASPAVYDTRDGRCLNELNDEWARPDGEWQKAPRGRELFLVDSNVVAFDRLLYSPKPYQVGRYFASAFVQASHGEALLRGRPGQLVRLGVAASVPDAASKPRQPAAAIWENGTFAGIDALAVAANAVIVVGQSAESSNDTSPPRDEQPQPRLAALRLADGEAIWSTALPGAPAPWGLAIDRDGRVLITLEDGRLVCYGASAESN